MHKADFHLHSSNSPDAVSSLEEIVQAAIFLGLDEIAVTDHFDVCRRPRPGWQFDARKYFKEFKSAKKKFGGKILLRSGVEIGQPHVNPVEAEKLLAGNSFDFVLGSVHNLSDDGTSIFSAICFPTAGKSTGIPRGNGKNHRWENSTFWPNHVPRTLYFCGNRGKGRLFSHVKRFFRLPEASDRKRKRPGDQHVGLGAPSGAFPRKLSFKALSGFRGGNRHHRFRRPQRKRRGQRIFRGGGAASGNGLSGLRRLPKPKAGILRPVTQNGGLYEGKSLGRSSGSL